MSYRPDNNSRGTYNNQQGYDSRLPPVNEKRFADVIDYSQQPPPYEDDDHYHQEQPQKPSMQNRNQYPQGKQQGGGGYDNYPNHGNDSASKTFASTGFSENAVHQHQQHNASSDPGEGRAVQLVAADPKSGRFALNAEFAEELLNYEGNVGFVTIAGKYRTGKSCLFNKVLNLRNDGFVVDSSTDACTQGIWIWSKPIYNERDNMYIFFLDTEGSNSVEKSSTHDAKIFALSILMSSYFIYNSVGAIDENSINDLSLTTNLSRNIAVTADGESQHTLSYYTPKFLWALRDFTLQIQDANGKPISSNQYLENALTDQSTKSKASETTKKVRQALLNFFKDRECMTFVRPVDEEQDLRRLNTIPNNKLRPEFMKQIQNLQDKIMTKVIPKQLKGVNLNMRMYFAMVEKYVEAINQGSVPNISTAWDHLVENECREAFEESKDLYEAALKKFFFNEERAKGIDELYNILKNIRDTTLERYNKITTAIERNDVAQEYKAELKNFVDEREKAVAEINEELNQANNEDLIRNLAEIIKDNVSNNTYGPKNIQDFNDDFSHFLTSYDSNSQGFSKTETLVKFLGVFQPAVINSLMMSLNKSYQESLKQMEHNKARFEENDKMNQMNRNIMQEKLGNAEEQLQMLKAERAEHSNKVKKLMDQIQRMSDEQESDKAKIDKLTKELRQRERDVDELTAKNSEMVEKLKKGSKKTGCF